MDIRRAIKEYKMKKILIIGAGGAIQEKLMKRLERWADMVFCADGGGDIARKMGITISAIIGDFDSISKETYEYYTQKQDAALIKILEQETTDMEKAVMFSLRSSPSSLIILTCVSGSRADHFLHSLGLLIKYGSRTNIRIVDGESIISLKTTSFRENCTVNERISLIPFGSVVKNTGTMGLKYPLQGEDLIPGVKESVSNQSIKEYISVNFDSGTLLLFRDAETVINSEIIGDK